MMMSRLVTYAIICILYKTMNLYNFQKNIYNTWTKLSCECSLCFNSFHLFISILPLGIHGEIGRWMLTCTVLSCFHDKFTFSYLFVYLENPRT